MIDPISTVSAAAARAAGQVVMARVRDWLRGDEFDRLLGEVAERIGNDAGALALAPLREDEEVVALVAAFFESPSAWREAEIVAAIEKHVGPLDDEGSSRETAERIALLIHENAWRAIQNDREAIVHEIRAVGFSERPSVVVLTYDWVPRQALSRVQELMESDPMEAHQLEQELADQARRPRTVENLIRNPKGWVKAGSGALWAALGDLATAYGRLDAAERAFVAAADLPGTDRVRMLTRAAQVAYGRGDLTRADEVLAEARGLDADHPSVAIVDALLMSDPAERLDRLSGIEPLDDAQAGAIEATRSLAHLALGDIAAAKFARDLAVSRSDAPNIAELSPAIAFIENARRTIDESVDVQELTNAATAYLELRVEAASRERTEESLQLGSRASEIYSMLGDYRRAASILEELAEEVAESAHQLSHEVRRNLANAATEARRPELVLRLLDATPQTDVDRLLLVQARALVERDPAGATVELNALLDSSDEDVRSHAARLLLAGALSEGFEWSESALKVLQEEDQVLADVMRAARLHKDGETDEAERLLHRRVSDSRALGLLIDLAAERGEWETALQLHGQLSDRGNTPERRYTRARLLEQSGELEGALGQLGTLMADSGADTGTRSRAFARRAEILSHRRRFADLVETARAWLEFDPHEIEPAWLIVYGLARLGRWEEALRALDHGKSGGLASPLEPRDEQNAELAATVLFRALPPQEAIPRIVRISERFDRSMERLEVLIVAAGLPASDLSADVAEQVSRSTQEFNSRFPNSRAIRAVEAPTDREALTQFLSEHLAAGAAEAENMFRTIYRGEAPMTLLAALLRKHVPEVWAAGGFLPIGYGDPILDELEATDAQAGVLRPAVWDGTALYVVGGLGEIVAQAVVNALPASVLPQSTLDDVIGWGDGPTANSDGEQTILGWDPSGQTPRLTIVPADETIRQQAGAQGTGDLARRLRPVPDADPESPGRFDVLLEVDEGRETSRAFMSWPATFAVAARLQLPIFSDDRYIRLEARRAGIPNFGTVALLRALVERGMLDPAVLHVSLRRLRASGAVGLVPSDAELIAEVAAVGWGVTDQVARALHDPTGWREPVIGMRRLIALLRAVHHSAPGQFLTWVERALDSARVSTSGIEGGRLASALLSLCWITDDADFARAMTNAVRAVRFRRGYLDDPVPVAAQMLVDTFAEKPPLVRMVVARMILRSTAYHEHPALIALMRLPEVGTH